MFKQFINREGELEFLERRYRAAESELIVIHDRRRIEKTELINTFTKDKP